MLATAIIVFREVLEAALVVGIVMAACRSVPRVQMWIATGIAAGLIGSCAVAYGANAITEAAEGMGQELLNAAILFTAAAMLGWHSIWMARHGRELALHVGAVGREVSTGHRPLIAVAVVVGAAVLREGSETVLFLTGIARGGDTSVRDFVLGGLLGTAAGVAAGMLIYLGLLRIPTRHLFNVTNLMILLLMAGMAAQATGFLVQAGYVAPIIDPVWDTSKLLSEHSLTGKILHTLVGYEARPTAIQLIIYALVLACVPVLGRMLRERHVAKVSAGHAAAVAFLVMSLMAGAGFSDPARAEFKLRYPNIDYREVEIEHNYSIILDKNSPNNRDISMPVEVGVGIHPNWFFEIEGEFAKASADSWTTDAVSFENYFMLTEPGQYWLDASIFAEYSRAAHSVDPDSVEIGLLLQKDVNRWLNTLNVYWAKPVSAGAENIDTVSYAWQTRYRLNQYIQPGFEVYGEIEDIKHAGSFNDQQFRAGPVIVGSYNLGEIGAKGKVKYEVGYLFGMTDATESQALRTRIEYEIPF
jgi:high-affinity iron transporter